MITLKATSVFEKNYTSKARNIVNEGSSRSSKTFSICQALILKGLEKKQPIAICRAKLTWLKSTAMLDFYEVMEDQFNLYNPSWRNKVENTYTLPNGTIFQFMGTDEHRKIHGFKSSLAWLNESNEISYNSYRQLAIRNYGQIYFDFNPAFTEHWIIDRILSRDDTHHIHSTYKDNPFLDKILIDEIERLEPTEINKKQGTADETLWKIYGLGQRAAHRGLIFKDVKLCKSLPKEETWKKCFYGLDFGYTNDVTALIKIVLSQGELYFKELVYATGLINCINHKNPETPSIEKKLRDLGINHRDMIWADAAEPKSIEELRLAGFNIQATSKGADSVVNGINQINQYNCYITEDSINLIKERNNYKWHEDDKTGKLINKPVDAFNHGWDAISYAARKELPYSRVRPYNATTPMELAKKPGSFKNVFEEIAYRESIRDQEPCFDDD